MSTNASNGPPLLVRTSKKRPLTRDSTTDLNSSGHRTRHTNKRVRVESTVESSSPIAILRDKDVNCTINVDTKDGDAGTLGKKVDSQDDRTITKPMNRTYNTTL